MPFKVYSQEFWGVDTLKEPQMGVSWVDMCGVEMYHHFVRGTHKDQSFGRSPMTHLGSFLGFC